MKKNEISVMIAEDEPIILNNIAKKVEAVGEFIYVAGKATSGKDILNLLKDVVPDILITDIEMPGMNGLDLIRHVRNLYPQVHILILSGYSNFEYARTALQQGVDDYLLKPITQEDLSAVIWKAVDIITKEKHQKERNILSRTLQGNRMDISIPSSFHDSHFLLIFIAFGNTLSSNTEFPRVYDTDALFLDIDFHPLFASNHFDHIWVIDETFPLHKFIILHSVSDSINIDFIANQFSNHIYEMIPDYPYSIVMHDTLIPYSQIGNCASQIRLSFMHYTKPFTQEYSLYPGNGTLIMPDPEKKKEQVDFLYQLQNAAAFLKYAKKILSEYITLGFSQQIFADFFSQIFSALPVLFHIDEALCMQMKSNILQQALFHLSSASFFHLLQTDVLQLINNMDTEIATDNICQKVKQYILHNYNQHISMSDLSEIYGYTPSYINRLFKKEYGIPPLQYQTSLRLDKAKELLQSEILIDIKDIAASIGYEDARYFSRIFKNEFGITPSEWQNKRLK